MSTKTFTSLSSTTSTFRPVSGPGSAAAMGAAASSTGARFSGISTVNAEPAPTSLRTSMRPPCRSTSLRTIASPRPLPPYFIPTS